MTARRIDSSWWVDFRYAGVRYRKRSPDNSKGGAKAYEATLRGRLVRGEPLDGERAQRHADERFSAFAERWLHVYAAAGNKPSEYYTKRLLLNQHLLPAFGRLRLSEVQTPGIEDYKRSKLASGLSPKSVKNHLAVLSKALRCAVEWHELDTVPMIRFPKIAPAKFHFYTPEEVSRLQLAAERERHRSMFRLVADTGIRRGELMGLQWTDVDFERNQVCVARSVGMGLVTSTKTHRIRYVPLSLAARAALIAVGPQASGYIFGRDDGSPGSPATASKMNRRVCARAGLRVSGWHVLRHTFASTLAIRGVPLYHIQALLGHSSPVMTQRYAHLTPGVLADAIRALDVPADISSSPNPGQPVGKLPIELAEMFRHEAA